MGAKTGALMFACPRDNGAEALYQFSKRARHPEPDEAPITQSRNWGLYRAGGGKSKGCLESVKMSGCNVAITPHMKPEAALRLEAKLRGMTAPQSAESLQEYV